LKVLIVKTSSMGDVVHALPALTDMQRHVPGLVADWLVEAPFAAIPALHPAVRRVLPLGWRKWRKTLASGETRGRIGEFRSQLRAEAYDLVLDMQGLLKSVLWTLQARGPSAGYDVRSAREPVAGLFYRRTARVPRHTEIQAVERCRRLAAAHLGYALPATPPDFGIVAPTPEWPVPAPAHAVLIPGASRPEKLWPEERWIGVGRALASQGALPVVLWGSPQEGDMARRIAQECGGVVPPFLSVRGAAGLLGAAKQVVGLDTGFTHLAAALGRPTVGIYCDYEPGLAAVTGSGPVASLGGVGQVPALQDVLAAMSAGA
jgi:heptosyltransferase-1